MGTTTNKSISDREDNNMSKIDRIIGIIRTLNEEAPTVSVASGNIAGVEPGETPPVRKRKKRYIYAKGSRKAWLQNDKSGL